MERLFIIWMWGGYYVQGVKQNVLCMRDLKNDPAFISSTLPDLEYASHNQGVTLVMVRNETTT